MLQELQEFMSCRMEDEGVRIWFPGQLPNIRRILQA